MSMGFFGNMDDAPEPIKAFFEHIQSQQDQHEMGHDAAEHQILLFLEEMTEEQLRSFRMIMRAVLNSPALAPYYVGAVETLLQQKFQICPYHGVNHDAQLEETLNGNNDTP